jgi:hypothetical protein
MYTICLLYGRSSSFAIFLMSAFSSFVKDMFIRILFSIFTQTCNIFTYLYAFLHNDIYSLLLTVLNELISKRKCEIDDHR